jgi:hypothetical protein
MPVEENKPGHREKISIEGDPNDALWFAACVARPVSKREALGLPAAKAALDKEWDKLIIKQKCWDEKGVREWDDVAAEAKRLNIKTHVGRVFDMCTEKNAELPLGHPNRKYKGRRKQRQR